MNEWQRVNALYCSCRGADDYCPCQNDPNLYARRHARMTAIPDMLPLTYEQIRDVYYAGAQRGSDEATSFEWGSSAPGKWHDNLAEALYEILNEGFHYGEPGFRDWEDVEAWVVAGESAHASGIEARSDATPKSGAAEGESPVPKADAQPCQPSPSTQDSPHDR